MRQMLDRSRGEMIMPNPSRVALAIVGSGTTGSHLAQLATAGGLNVHLFDDAVLSAENLSAGMFNGKRSRTRGGTKKVQAVKEVADFLYDGITDNLTTYDSLYYGQPLDFGASDFKVLALCTDTKESRKFVFNESRNAYDWVIDIRIGGTQYDVYSIIVGNPYGNQEKYRETLESPAEDLMCGEKGTSFIAAAAASMAMYFISAYLRDSNFIPPYWIAFCDGHIARTEQTT